MTQLVGGGLGGVDDCCMPAGMARSMSGLQEWVVGAAEDKCVWIEAGGLAEFVGRCETSAYGQLREMILR